MSTSAIMVNDCERGNSVRKPSTGTYIPFNSCQLDNLYCSYLINYTEPTGRQGGTQRQSRINTSSPTSNKDTGVSDTRPGRQSRTHPATAVKQNTNEGNSRCRKQERIPSTSAVEPTTNGRNNKRRMQRRTPDTDDREPGTNEENAMPSRTRRTSVFERDLTPAERAIPATTLLHNLGNHLSAYARAGRVRHSAICFYSSFLSLFLVKI